MKTFKTILRWIGIVLIGLIFLVFVSYLVIYSVTESRINKKYAFSDPLLKIPTDSNSLAKGKHLYQIRGCEDCHGVNGQGGIFLNDALLMQVTAPNITPGNGGLPGDFDIADWLRVLRHGVDKNGQSLFMMPSHEIYQLSNDDLARIIAYCRQLKPVNTTQKKLHSIGPVGRVLMTLNNVTILPAEKINHRASPVNKRDEIVGEAYGKYLATGCQGCHRANLQGGGPLAPGFPPVPDITSSGIVRKWSDASFIQAIRTGRTPEGKTLDNQYMPWKSIRHFTDDELKSIYLYLKSLPAKR